MNPSILSPKPSVKWEERKNKREKIKTKIEDIYIYILNMWIGDHI